MKRLSQKLFSRTGVMDSRLQGGRSMLAGKPVLPTDIVAGSRPVSSSLVWSLVSCITPALVHAAPEGGQVVAGSAGIARPDANTTVINQSSDRTIINWQRFNIGAQEVVQFIQPDASAIALNRVVGGDPSQILGNLSANGQVFLVNPNGIYFGQNATVDVGAIVASVHDISNRDFLEGNYVFSKAQGVADAGVVNDGSIRVADGGYAVLLGDSVQNNGLISARLGTVALAAGRQMTMDVKADGLVSIAVDQATIADLAGVDNTGDIIANGGRVLMTAKIANDLIDTAINNSGMVVANSIVEHNGAIFLSANGGDIVNSGTLDASIKADSEQRGGILVYSDRNVTLTGSARLLAKGGGDKEGGTVRVIAKETLHHQQPALIDVSSEQGAGGFVEVSGHGGLALRGAIELGQGGSLLIDPKFLKIQIGTSPPGFSTGGGTLVNTVGAGFIADQLNTGNNVTLVASDSISADTTSLIATGSGNLAIKIGTVTATGGTLGGVTNSNGGCTGNGFCLSGKGSYKFTPGASGNINLANLSIDINGGLDIAAGTSKGSSNARNNVIVKDLAAGGNITITAGNNIDINGIVNRAGSSLNAVAGENITLGSAAALGNTNADLAADVNLTAAGDVVLKGNVSLANNKLTVTADADNDGNGRIDFGNPTTRRVIASKGDISLRAQDIALTVGTGATASARLSLSASNLDMTARGTISIKAGIIDISALGSFAQSQSAAVDISATNRLSLKADSLSIGGGSIQGSVYFGSGVVNYDAGARLNADVINIDVVNGMTIAGGTENANIGTTATSSFAMFANASARIQGFQSLNLRAASLKGVQGNTSPPPVNGTVFADVSPILDAGGMFLETTGDMDLAAINVSSGLGSAPGVTGDQTLLTYMAAQGITPPDQPAPNAKFRAGGVLTVGSLIMGSAVPYLWFEADAVNFVTPPATGATGVQTGAGNNIQAPDSSDIVVQFSPYTPSKSIGVEQQAGGAQDVIYTNADHFSKLPGTTILIGSSSQTGDIVIGDQGNVDILAKNMVVATAGSITGLDKVISSGIVAELRVGEIPESFVTPVLSEVELPISREKDIVREKKKKKKIRHQDEDNKKAMSCEAG